MKKIIGIDLAWQSERNTTAVAVGELSKKSFRITKVHDSISSIESLIKVVVNNESAIAGVSIDAPLIINNTTGQRSCERELSKEYGSRKSSCHSSNITPLSECCECRSCKSFIEYRIYSSREAGNRALAN
jgi:predicted RNase H-like nuclease